MTNPAYDWIEPALATIHRAGWYRSTQTIQGRPGAVVQMDGRSLLNFASNDYLGLAGDERLAQAAIAAIQAFGTGSTGSRLLSGQRDLHQQLEQAIARWKQTEAAIVFSSGYLANVSTVSALVGKRDLILADQYNHSSLKTGAIVSGATVVDYAHSDVAQVEALLVQQRDRFRRCLIVTDSVFSMAGDLCPLPALAQLAAQYEAMLLVDEAHATGVLGPTGAGGVEQLGCRQHPLVQVGTLSKALGSLGGYVAGSAALIDFLRNRAAGWIYTTGLSPADTAAAFAAVTIVPQEPDRRTQLWQNLAAFKQGCAQVMAGATQPIHLLPSDSAIVCLEVDRPATAMRLAQALRAAGLFVSAVRPPTVPTSRLRLTMMATHLPEQIDRLLSALDQALAGADRVK